MHYHHHHYIMHLWCLKDLQTLFQDFPIIMPRNKNNNIKTYYLHLPEVFVNFTFHTMCSKSKWDKALILVVGVVLVQGIIQTFVQLVKIEQNNCPACFHADLDAIDIPTYLFWERHFQRYIINDCQNYKIITLLFIPISGISINQLLSLESTCLLRKLFGYVIRIIFRV